jgi:hypothetical protein
VRARNGLGLRAAVSLAAKNSRGFVIVQVERIAVSNSLNPREVQILGILVDCVVVADPANHVQTYGATYSPAFSGRQRVPMDRVKPPELDERKIIARRCAFELPPGGVGRRRRENRRGSVVTAYSAISACEDLYRSAGNHVQANRALLPSLQGSRTGQVGEAYGMGARR